MGANPRDVWLLARHEFRLLWRSPQGMLALAFLAILVGWALSKLAGNAGFINTLSAGGLSQEGAFVWQAVKWLADLDDTLIERLFVMHSPFVSMLFVLVAFALPLLTMICALDQNASDIGGKGVRFLLTRTGRTDLVLGRLLGTSLFWAVGIAAAGLAGTAVALAVDDHHSLARILLDGAWMTLGWALIAIPFLAFMALCAVATGNPLLAVATGIGAYLAVALLGGVGGWIHDALKAIRYLFPAPLRYSLMTGSGPQVMVAALAMLAYGGVFLAGALALMRRRDL